MEQQIYFPRICEEPPSVLQDSASAAPRRKLPIMLRITKVESMNKTQRNKIPTIVCLIEMWPDLENKIFSTHFDGVERFLCTFSHRSDFRRRRAGRARRRRRRAGGTTTMTSLTQVPLVHAGARIDLVQISSYFITFEYNKIIHFQSSVTSSCKQTTQCFFFKEIYIEQVYQITELN